MFSSKIDGKSVFVEELSPDHDLFSFDCGDKDLNEFLREDALRYQEQLIAKTYVVIYLQKIIAFFSVMNDSLKLNIEETMSTPRLRRLHEYPAIKIGRLGVDKQYKQKGFGSFIIGYVVGLARLVNTNSACRFVTVDSYHESVPFYEKQGFIRNQMYEKKQDFTSIRLDLLK